MPSIPPQPVQGQLGEHAGEGDRDRPWPEGDLAAGGAAGGVEQGFVVGVVGAAGELGEAA